MELILAIAALCNGGGETNYSLKCQKYFVECYETHKRNINRTAIYNKLILDEDVRILVSCIKDRK